MFSSNNFFFKKFNFCNFFSLLDKVTERLSMVLVRRSGNDLIWRRLCQNLITKMPFPALEPFVTQLLLSIPW